MMKHKKNYWYQRGFSLIELLIYMGLVSIFVSGFVMFGWNLILNTVKSEVMEDVDYNLMFANQKLSHELRLGTEIYNIGSDFICVGANDPVYDPMGFYLNNGVVEMRWGGGDTSCASFSNTADVTSNTVTVTEFVVSDYSVGDSENIGYRLGIESLNPGGRAERDYQHSITSSVELRN